jgi:hypothetical protein
VHADPLALEDALLDLGVRCLPTISKVLILVFDATDDPLHGRQEGRFFDGYYGNCCYLPLYYFCGSVPLWAQLRSSDKDACTGTMEALKKIIVAIRRWMPKVKIEVRGIRGSPGKRSWRGARKSGMSFIFGAWYATAAWNISPPGRLKARLRFA